MSSISGGTGPLTPITPVNKKTKSENNNNQVAPPPQPDEKTKTDSQQSTDNVNKNVGKKSDFGQEAGLTMRISQGLKNVTSDANPDDVSQTMDLAMELIEEFYPDKAEMAGERLGENYTEIEAELQEILNSLPDPGAISEFKEGLKKLTTGPGC